MYFETISKSMHELLVVFAHCSWSGDCYLAGGTALALQLGHRSSEDLDFVVPQGTVVSHFEGVMNGLNKPAIVVSKSQNHLQCIVESIKVDFIQEQLPLRFPLIPLSGQLKGLSMADGRDIGCMKLLSISSRGSKKDFIDLYCITRKLISLKSLVQLVIGLERHVQYSRLLFLKGIVDFEDAEGDPEPSMLWGIRWEEVKARLTEEVIELSKDYYEK